jgi:hypothetical protein
MAVRRTTLAAEADDLALLQTEARKRGISLAQLLREVVAERAQQLRTTNRPRFGVIASGGKGIAAAMEQDPDGPAARSYRS